MTDRISIAAVSALLLLVGCSGADPAHPADDAGHDVEVRDDASMDSGDTGVGGDDADVRSEVTPDVSEVRGDCAEQTLDTCVVHPGCVWNGDTCLSPEGFDSFYIASLVTVLPGYAYTVEHPHLDDGSHDVRLMVAASGEQVRGILSILGGERTVQHAVQGSVDPFGGEFMFELSRGRCSLSDGTSCAGQDVVDRTPFFDVTGYYDGEQILFAAPGNPGSSNELPPFVNLRLQPNDGIKPVMAPEPARRYTGSVSGIPAPDLPFPSGGTATLSLDSLDLETARPQTLAFEDATITRDGDPRIVADSWKYADANRLFWFQIESDGSTFVVVGEESGGTMAGLIARDTGGYWSADADPLPVSSIALEDVDLVFVLYAEQH